MESDFRPHISRIYPDAWNTRSGNHVNGVVLFGYSGIAAHLTKSEAFALANRIVDAAEQLPDPPAPRHLQSHGLHIQQMISAPRSRLVAADGTEEKPLPVTQAD
ncbi:hypothetical protein [Glutamicibacter ardleyensis]|uniref:hypothetical protein n=1 Tax=Glutamicibacter ardleyensis TaxID=225894 RepID=UPI003FD225FE